MTTLTLNGAITRSVPLVDRFAISLSILCLVHCLLLPVLFVMLPSLGTSLLGSESMHTWLVYAVIPSSLFALGMGCRKHRRGSFILLGMIGLGFLLLGIAIEEVSLSEIWEKLFTVFGALLIAFAHFRNYQLCRASKSCGCKKP